jgi:hypothetical protein
LQPEVDEQGNFVFGAEAVPQGGFTFGQQWLQYV